MIRWIPYTFIRTVLFFVGGILLAFSAPDLIPENIGWTAVGMMVLLYVAAVVIHRQTRLAPNPGFIALPLIFMLGYMNLVTRMECRDADHLANHRGGIALYKAVVTRFAEEKERTWKTEARVLEIYDGRWSSAKGKVLLYFPKEDFQTPYRYGDVLIVKGAPVALAGPANPGEFDYRAYLSLRNIYHQHFVRRADVQRVNYAPPSRIVEFSSKARLWAEAVLHRFISGSRERGIATALVLGVTDGLDDEVVAAYSATGVMHILAVSGLHISILYFILLKILSPLNKVSRGRWIIAFISLAALWLYASVTGLSPSVLRAVGMFSFLAVARPWARRTNIYNTLAASAFCLLIFDPFLIRSVGFQLSYIAVLGIVYIYPRLVRLWEPEHWFAVEVWKLSAVSIAAQLATFPLGLYYFHQFPNYFLIANLLVVPLSFAVLIGGLAVITVSIVPWLASLLGTCLGWVIKLLNGIVFVLDDLPFNAIRDVYISAGQCLLLLSFLVVLLCLCEYKKFRYVVVAFGVVVAFSSLQWLHFFENVKGARMTVYKVPGYSAMDLMGGGRTHFVADTGLAEDAGKIGFHIAPNRQLCGIRRMDRTGRHLDFKGGRLIFWRGKVILQLTDPGFELPGPVSADWVVIGHNAVRNIRRITEGVTCGKVILDSSNSIFFASRFLEEAKLYKLEIHSVLHQGAFISKIETDDT